MRPFPVSVSVVVLPAMSTISPPDELIAHALKALREHNPSLGAAKLHSKLLAHHADWSVSEKRVRRILIENNLQLSQPTVASKPEEGGAAAASGPRPTSRVIDDLSPSKWTSKVKVVNFGPAKGKGLVATQEIAQGEDIWKEDPFILAPEWDIYDLQAQSNACSFCSTPFNSSNISKTLSCPSSTNSSLPNAGACTARFCNRLCLQRTMARSHPLLCPAANPASSPLMTFARQFGWLAAHAIAQSVARVLLSHEQGREGELKEDLRFLDSLAQMSMEERWKIIEPTGVAPDLDTWHKAHKLTVQAFHDPPNARDKKALGKILRKPLPEYLKTRLFDLDAYLRTITSMSLNLEAHGGLYVLHSHMNHSCDPSVSVRHFDQKTALSRITLRAQRPIKPGEELTVTYVDPAMPLRARRSSLIPWVFGTCACVRCMREERDAKDTGDGEEDADGGNADGTKEAHPDLEQELRHGLGLL